MTGPTIAACAVCDTELLSSAAGSFCPADVNHRGEVERIEDAEALLSVREAWLSDLDESDY